MYTIIFTLVVLITSLLTLLFIYFLISVITNKNDGSNGDNNSNLNVRLNPLNGYSLSYVNILNVPDQGKLKSCGAVQISTLMSYYYYIQLNNTTILSALALYYYGRTINGDGSYIDNGSTIDNYLNAINTYGLLSENDWPYIQSDFYKKPFSNSSTIIFQPKLRWNTVDTNITTIKDFIRSGIPVLLDIMIYKSFTDSNSPGLIVVPNTNDSDSYIARHAVSLWGWDDDSETFIMLNTWGTSSGYNGWFFLPYDYILKPSLSTQFFYNMTFIKNFTYV